MAMVVIVLGCVETAGIKIVLEIEKTMFVLFWRCKFNCRVSSFGSFGFHSNIEIALPFTAARLKDVGSTREHRLSTARAALARETSAKGYRFEATPPQH
jgi:hypothetical protein